MNLRATLQAIRCLLAAAPLVFMTSACGGDDDRNSGVQTEISAISDSIRAGNMSGARRLTEAMKATALQKGDSMKWSEAMIQQGVNAYYQRDPEVVAASADSAIHWLERRKPGKEQARLLAKAYQTYGSYYDQYQYNADSTAKYLRKSVDKAELSGISEDLPQYYGNYANPCGSREALTAPPSIITVLSQ